MPTSLQFRRGTTSQNNSFTGSVGEISVDTTLDTLRVHDGSTAGGFEITSNAATQTLTNKTLTSPTINGATIAMSTNKITGLGDPTNAQDAATKAYIDSELSSLSSTTLTQGNSNVVVADTGTGTFTVTIDGSTHSTFAAAGITLSQGAFVGNLTGNVTGNTSGSSGSCTGNAATATTATTATNVTVADESSDTSCNVLFTTAATGDLAPKSGTNLTFNSSAGTLTTTLFSGTATQARYADLAEKYVSDKPAMAGTVMVFGGSKEVTISQTAQDRKMAGVVSTNPAYLMNKDLEEENTVVIALQGRVPCKVQGFVRKGDMMVTGSLPGVAQAWREEGNPPYGTVIGKSLVDKDSRDVEVIEVVVGVR